MSKPRFTNTESYPDHGFLDILKWKFGSDPEKPVIPDAPDTPADVIPVSLKQPGFRPAEGWKVVWLGHASFLVQGVDRTILIDPILSDYCAPVRISGMRRRSAAACQVEDLPEIDAVLLTHNHYDHLDLLTLRALRKEIPYFIAEGHGAWLKKTLGLESVTEMPWGREVSIFPGMTLTATAAQHFSGRTPFDRNKGHWCGWLLEEKGAKIWHAGDSGYCGAFAEIGARYGPIDFAMIPIGAYQPRRIMKPMHMNPEEAVQAFLDARCVRAVGMHWGTFMLTDEPMGEPPLRLAAELARRGMREDAFTVGPVGSVWTVSPEGRG